MKEENPSVWAREEEKYSRGKLVTFVIQAARRKKPMIVEM